MKKPILTVSVILVFILMVAGIALSFMNNDAKDNNMKEIRVEVVANGNTKVYDIKTDSKYLGDALLEEKIISGEEGQYGLFITEAAGIKANSDNKEWWCITKGGESIQLGISSIEISDKDKYELTLMQGYDN